MSNTPKNKIYLLLGIITSVVLYYILLLNDKGTVEQGIIDWGIDMGYTQLFWGVLLIGICLFFIIYPRQQVFTSKMLTKAHTIVFGSVILFVVLGASIFTWITHDQTLNFYHNPLWDFLPVDKFGHLFWSFVITLTVLAVQPRKAYAVILWCAFALYELFEIVVIYNFGETEFDKDVVNVFASEMADIPVDLVVNSIGWICAIAVVVVVLKRRFR